MKAKKTINKKKKNPKVNIKTLKEKIKVLEDSIKDSKDKNTRLLAEFDNYKRRTIEDRNRLLKYDGLELVKSILPILDDIDRTLSLKELKKNEVVYNGISMINEKLKKTLNDMGVAYYNSIGDDFNPDLHEAIMMKKTKKKINKILEEFEKGYKYNDRVIRHSKVVVGE
tara:strand:+ start:263 stop:769 length:507 start_codon:yes stop_codon:yes gene_type:complete